MPFPGTPLDTKVELQLSSVWTDVTAFTYTRDPITIRRGRADEASGMEPASCSITFNNRDGRFSPRNPVGAYFGSIGRNTPVRVSVLLGAVRLVTFAAGDRVTTPDSAGLSVTGDIDLRADATVDDWSRGIGGSLLTKSVVAGQRSYRLGFTSTGRVFFEWSSDGTAITQATSAVPLVNGSGRQTIRATFDVDNGAGGKTATFFTGPSVAGPWTQLGDPVTTAGVTTIFDGSDPLTVGASGADVAGARIHAAQVRQGIDGTIRANPDFTIQSGGTTSFVDSAGNTWTVNGTASITNRRFRFHGEVSNWPPRWDLSGRDVWTPVTGAGITRRLGQGASPLLSALRRGIGATGASLVAYWPMEDGDTATQFASAMPGGSAMSISGSPDLASNTRIAGSAPLPTLNSAVASGLVPTATAGTIEARCVVAIPAGGDTNLGVFMRIFTTGTYAYWDFYYATTGGGTLVLGGFDSAGNIVIGPLTTHTNANGKVFQGVITLETSGGNVSYKLTTVDIASDGGLVQAGLSAGSVGRATRLSVNAESTAILVGSTVGHPHVLSAVSANPFTLENYVRGWAPETAGRRVERLCTEESVPFVSRGIIGPGSGTPISGLGDFVAMGAQPTTSLLEAIGEAATADIGALIEPRESLSLAYRTRESIYNQTAVLALAYGNLSNLEPVEDDQNVRNDITANRVGGSSARARLETGALSVSAPPAGVGIYDSEVQLNLFADPTLGDQARWRVHLGTVDEARYPSIFVDLKNSAFAASSALTTSALDLDVGDLITISDPPAWLPPDQIRQIAQGFTETLEQFAYSIEVNCTPASVWDVGVYDQSGNPGSRYSSSGTTTTGALTTTATSVPVSTPAGPIWTTDPAEYPLDLVIGGERMTATACSGATTAQTFTVTRSVNGVVKTHLTGATVELFKPARYAL